jgi:hypothetical protein
MGEPQRRLTLTKQRCTCVALRERYTELLRLREFVKQIEDSTAGAVEISVNERVLPMLPGAHRLACVPCGEGPNPKAAGIPVVP